MNHSNTYFDLHLAENQFTFTLYPVNTKFNRLSGIYIFLIIRSDGIPAIEESGSNLLTDNYQPTTLYSLLYAGITNNFYTRLKQHHKIAAALQLGMTHIGILKIASGRKRKKIERKILKHLNPPLNQTWLIDV